MSAIYDYIFCRVNLLEKVLKLAGFCLKKDNKIQQFLLSTAYLITAKIFLLFPYFSKPSVLSSGVKRTSTVLRSIFISSQMLQFSIYIRS